MTRRADVPEGVSYAITHDFYRFFPARWAEITILGVIKIKSNMLSTSFSDIIPIVLICVLNKKITNIFQLFCFTNANVIIILNFLQVVLQGSYQG